MFKILNKKVLHENILQFTLEAPLIARKAEVRSIRGVKS